MVIVIAVWGLAMIICAGVAFFAAPMRGRNGQNWAFWSFVFPPVLAILFWLPRTIAPIKTRARIKDDELRDILH